MNDQMMRFCFSVIKKVVMTDPDVQVEALVSETSLEYQLAFLCSLFLILLMVAIIGSNYVTHILRWHFLPEAGATIGIGIIASVLCLLKSGSIATSLMAFDPNFFFVGLLPPIIFNSGYTMKRRYFFENITPILTYSILGTLTMSLVTGVLLYSVGRLGWVTKLSLAESLTFGSLINATDTVSILAVFQELHVDPRLFYLVFGESSLNDAVAICLFTTFSKFIGYSYSFTPMLFAIFEFGLVFVGSTLIGVAFGMLPALLFKFSNLKSCLMHEVGVYVMFVYLPFTIAQILEMSGVVAIIFAGIAMKHYASPNLSKEAQEICSRVFETIAYLAETAVFLNLGLSVFALQNGYNIIFIVFTAVFCLIARACNVYPLTALLNKRKGAAKITRNQQHMIWYSGLRGAVAFALAKSFPGEKRNEIIATTMIIILLSIFVMGGGTVSMLNALKIPRLTPEEELALDQTVKPYQNMRLLQFDNKYLIPFVTNLCESADGTKGDTTQKHGRSKSFASQKNDHDNGEEDDVIEIVKREVRFT
nr:Monovalent Cation:Proton Antiporter1 (CPA1) Family putative [Albugo laibachii Nc14]|eukprot:CCA25723.1 Monovalent Cation:Proton Antiporter1 (CPA1) Family putative [Albugo laibachii Nc14]